MSRLIAWRRLTEYADVRYVEPGLCFGTREKIVPEVNLSFGSDGPVNDGLVAPYEPRPPHLASSFKSNNVKLEWDLLVDSQLLMTSNEAKTEATDPRRNNSKELFTVMADTLYYVARISGPRLHRPNPGQATLRSTVVYYTEGRRLINQRLRERRIVLGREY
ncbi:predicted protein [Uncinocarpus reesii 1704]|uniref:Uncharacterized protein n=1 Tax=Uncinocarpus reesii (strain UAMH 1704) TaxID=336963 RepID=C4JWB1_UNCRE|nr:uncharacterized protein UREG_06853 [Uncinocarpus reesii 1704]EEP81988.1 predicted protein [Uncinocarpus reesii 1704]